MTASLLRRTSLIKRKRGGGRRKWFDANDLFALPMYFRKDRNFTSRPYRLIPRRPEKYVTVSITFRVGTSVGHFETSTIFQGRREKREREREKMRVLGNFSTTEITKRREKKGLTCSATRTERFANRWAGEGRGERETPLGRNERRRRIENTTQRGTTTLACERNDSETEQSRNVRAGTELPESNFFSTQIYNTIIIQHN